MRITVLYMGGSRGQTGCTEEAVELTQGATVASAADWVAEHHPTLAPLLESVRWARNLEFADLTDPLEDGDELAVLPPVAGGAPLTELTTDPIEPQSVVARVSGPSVGATVTFIGTVRDHSRGKSVSRLEYEAYEAMAERQLEKIADDCSALREGVEVAITHRYGRLEIGEISIVIAASAAHRDDAFHCCRAVIERIKVDLPIWKKEITTDGATWVGWGGG